MISSDHLRSITGIMKASRNPCDSPSSLESQLHWHLDGRPPTSSKNVESPTPQRQETLFQKRVLVPFWTLQIGALLVAVISCLALGGRNGFSPYVSPSSIQHFKILMILPALWSYSLTLPLSTSSYLWLK